MKTHLHRISMRYCAVLALTLNLTLAYCQSSPSPIIQDYDNTSLPVTYQINSDTTFCKGRTITIHGQYFKRATSGELWDTTQVFLAGQRIWPQSIVSQMGGTNDRIVLALPSTYLSDTCLRLEIVKRTVLALDTFFYTTADTICLTGDMASVTYGASVFCLGDTNPRPSITLLPPTATGAFCCRSGAPGFWVNPSTGEIPLHPGAVGTNNQFNYVTNHPRCADTLAFDVDIRPVLPGQATIQGQTFITLCQTSAPILADTANLLPSAGIFRSPTGLAMINPLIGLFDPALSPIGLHSLWWVPITPCFDSVEIQVLILPTTTATVGYPAIPLNLGVPTLCQGAPQAWPTFTSGNSGGTFFANPIGLDLGPNGEIDPANSQTGTYAIQYATTGQCPDTVTAIANLRIDTTLSAQFTLPQTQYCANDTLAPIAQTTAGLWQILNSQNQILSSTSTPPIPLALTLPLTLSLRHVTGGFCSDTASVPFSVLPTDDPAFTYPPNGNFCLGDPDPWPLIQGNGGLFYPVTTTTIIDTDGRLHLSASGAGTHTIRHITGGTCKDSLDLTVTIHSSASANFAYPASLFCTADTNPLPLILGTPGGTFSGDSGISLHPATGAILLGQSQPGTWNVTYSLLGSCQANFTQTVQISPTDSTTTIQYPQDHYCQAHPDATPLINGDTLGSFVAGGGIVFSNTDRGQLDLDAMLPGGPYIVYYDIANRCAIDTQDSIWIDTPDDPSFAYPNATYCEGGPNPIPNSIALPGGQFSESTASITFANDQTGEIDATMSLQGGPYFIQYTTAGPCPETATQQLTILPKPLTARLTVTPDTNYCQGQSLMLEATAGGAIQWQWYHNHNPLPTTDEFLLLSTELLGTDTVSVVMTNALGCTDSLSAVLRGLPVPKLTASVTASATNAQGTAKVQLQIITGTEGTQVDWQAIGTNLREITPNTGTISPFGPATPATLALTLTLNSSYDLARLKLLMTPRNATCTGLPDSLVVTLAPDTHTVFIPEVFTPNGDAKNDTWQITWQPNTDPADFVIHLFNGSGGKVLQMDGLHQNFDGATLPDGVYWWVLEEGKSDKRAVQSGGLTIRRR